MSEMLYCGECGKPYRRITWNIRGEHKVVWRCVSRLDYGKKYCKCSPSVEETLLHNAISEAITRKSKIEGVSPEKIIRHIQSYHASQDTESVLAKQNRLKELQKKFDSLTSIDIEQADTGEFDEQFEEKSKWEKSSENLEQISAIIEGLKNHPVPYDDIIVRQLIYCIKVVSKNMIQIYFKDGTTLDAEI